MNEISTTQHDEQLRTRQRLLEVAGEVFAEKGFRNATVREICEKASANVAAINYHFGGKEQLYAAVCQGLFHAALTKYPPTMGAAEGVSAEKRLGVFIKSFLYRACGEGQPAMQKVVVKEMADPSGVFPVIVEQMVRPQFLYVRGIVRELMGDVEVEAGVLDRCVFSVIGQCLFYRFAQPVIRTLRPEMTYDEATLDVIAEHVTRFVLAGIEATRDRLLKGKKESGS